LQVGFSTPCHLFVLVIDLHWNANSNLACIYILAFRYRKLVEDYDFDGIDIDWEYPGYAEHMGTPADKENYSLLLHDIRQELDALGEKNDRTYGLTAALPCGTSNMNNMEIETISEYLTEFNLMTYGMFLVFDESIVKVALYLVEYLIL
jgi:GH18 family chitinase